MLRARLAPSLGRAQDAQLERFLHDPALARRMAADPLHACLGRWLPSSPGASVLEVGCGPGRYVAMLSSLGFQVTGIDPHRFRSWDVIEASSNARLLDKVVAEDLPFEDHSFDHAACLGALLYFDNPLAALIEIRRVVRPGGRIVVRTVNRGNLYTAWTGRRLDPASKNLYTMDELTDLVRHAGLVIDEQFSYGFWPPFCTDLWWYFVCVWAPVWLQHVASDALPEGSRVNNVIVGSVAVA